MNEFDEILKLYKQSLGAALKAERLRQKLSLRQLGDVANVDYKHIHSIENGCSNVSLVILIKLCLALGINIGDLFEFEHEINLNKLI